MITPKDGRSYIIKNSNAKFLATMFSYNPTELFAAGDQQETLIWRDGVAAEIGCKGKGTEGAVGGSLSTRGRTCKAETGISCLWGHCKGDRPLGAAQKYGV